MPSTLALVALAGAAGCKALPADGESVVQETTAPACAVGADCELSVTLPKGLRTNETAVVTSDWVHMGDRSTVKLDATTFGGVANTGKGDVILGVKTMVGSLSTRGLAFLRLQSEVRGPTFIAKTVQKEAQVVAPAVKPVPPGEPTKVAWKVKFTAATSGNAVNVAANVDKTLAPGRYGTLKVQNLGKLRLAAGAYYFDTFDVDKGGQVLANTTDGTVVIYVRGHFEHDGALTAAPRAGDVLLGLLTNETFNIGAELDAMVVAPNAQIKLLVTANGNAAAYDGIYIAARLTIDCDVKVVRRDISRTGPGWATVGIISTPGTGTIAPPLPPTAGTTPESYKGSVLSYMTNLYNTGYDGTTVNIPPHPQNKGHQPIDPVTATLDPTPDPSPPAGSPAATVAGGAPAIVQQFPRLDPAHVDPPPATPPKTCPLGMGTTLPASPTPLSLGDHSMPFGVGHPEDASRDFDAYFAMSGNTAYGAKADVGLYAYFDSSFNAGIRMFGIGVPFINASANGKTELFGNPTAQASANVAILGQTMGSWTFSQAAPEFHADLCGSLCSMPRPLLPTPIRLPVGPVTITIDAAVEGRVPANLTIGQGGPNFTIAPMIRAYATVGAFFGVGLQLGVEGQLDVLRIDIPLDAHLNWAQDNSPEVCKATIELDTGIKFRFSTLNGSLYLVARIDAFIGTIELARWQIMAFDGLVYDTPRTKLIDIPFEVKLDPAQCTIERTSCGAPIADNVITDLKPTGQSSSQQLFMVPRGYGAGASRTQCKNQYIIEIPEAGLTNPGGVFAASVATGSPTPLFSWDCLKEKGSMTLLKTFDGVNWVTESSLMWHGDRLDNVGQCLTSRFNEINPPPSNVTFPEAKTVYYHLDPGLKGLRVAVTATADCETLPLQFTLMQSTF